MKQQFNAKSFKKKGLTLLIEHSPCCLLSMGAGLIGVPFLYHNSVLELGFALGGAIGGEYIGHKIFHDKSETSPPHGHGWRGTLRRYGISLIFGLSSWGIHQKLFHHHHHAQKAETRHAFILPAHQAGNMGLKWSPGHLS